MQLGPLSLLKRTSGRGSLNLASWHSPHSLTWSWILTLAWAKPSYVKPAVQWSAVGPHLFRGASVGSIANVHAIRDNNGWQWGVTLLGVTLAGHRQRPMWFRDLYWRRETERYERRAA